jgi:hypothetical protein
MKFLYEENDTVLFTNVAQMPDDMFMVENPTGHGEVYSPEYRAELLHHETNRSAFRVTMVDDHGETIYVRRDLAPHDEFCFNAKYFKPAKDTLTKLLATLIN